MKPMIILHGENIVQTRNELAEVLQKAKENNAETIRLEAKNLSLADLEQTLGSTSLFQNPRTVIVEHLHSLPRSKRKNELIKQLADLSEQSDNTIQVVLVEKRKLTKTMLKQFPSAQVTESKITKSLFRLLDSLAGNLGQSSQLKKSLSLLTEAVSQDGEVLCLVMLGRQVRLLIQAKEGAKIAGPPFMISKLKKQAQTFSLDQLLGLHRQLLAIDYAMKTSSSPLSVHQQLDLLLLTL